MRPGRVSLLIALAALIDRARVLGEGVILAEPVADTLKQVNGEGRDRENRGSIDTVAGTNTAAFPVSNRFGMRFGTVLMRAYP